MTETETVRELITEHQLTTLRQRSTHLTVTTTTALTLLTQTRVVARCCVDELCSLLLETDVWRFFKTAGFWALGQKLRPLPRMRHCSQAGDRATLISQWRAASAVEPVKLGTL